MARTTINTQVIPDGTIVSADLSYPLTDFSSTGIDDNATTTAITIDSSQDVTFTSDAFFPDSGKAIFGAGSDLQIYHDGSNSYIKDAATGELYIQGDESIRFTNAAGTETLARFISQNRVDLYYDNAIKLATTSTGINVTGTVTADGLTVDGDAEVQGLRIDAVADVELEFGYGNTTHSKIIGDIVTASPTAGQLKFQTSTGGTLYERMRIATNGDISFYENTGTTAKLFWDASTERLGIGTPNPTHALHAESSGTTQLKLKDSTGGTEVRLGASANNIGFLWTQTNEDFAFGTGGSERMRIDSSGNFIFNENGNDSDFRVESNNQSTMLGVDAGGDYITMHGAGTTDAVLNMGPNTNKMFIRMHNGIAYNTASDLDVLVYGINDTAVDNGRVYQWRHRMEADGTPATGHNYVIESVTRGGSYQKIMTFSGTTVEGGMAVHHGLAVNEDSTSAGDFRVESDSNTHMLFVDAGSNHVNIGTSSDFGGTLNVNGGAVFDDADIFDPDTLGTGKMAIGQIADGGVFQAPGLGWGSSSVGKTAAIVATGGNMYFGVGDGSSANNMRTRFLIKPAEIIVNEDSLDCDFRVESTNSAHALFLQASNGLVSINNATDLGGGIFQVNDASGRWAITTNCTNPVGGVYYHWNLKAGGSNVGAVLSTTTGTTYQTTSDRRLKENIQTITNGTEKIMAMNPVIHTWKNVPEAPAVHGFIAQEMLEIAPESVGGDPTSEEMMSMDYGRITPIIVAALQDAHIKIAELESRLNKLERK